MQGDFDYIFFTGSTQAGRQIAKTAGERLIPYTLELGGKSPVIIDDTADLKVSARRIVKGKFMNAGQTCIAPDYLNCRRLCKFRHNAGGNLWAAAAGS